MPPPTDLTRWRPRLPLPARVSAQVSGFLKAEGIPKQVINIFRAAGDNPNESEVPIPGDAVLLGYSRWDEPVYADPVTGAVYLPPFQGEEKPMLVNSSLEAFTVSLDYIGNRYPFKVPEETIGAAMDLAAELTAKLQEIDEASTLEPDGFWATFLDDVANGDYSSS